MNLVPESVLREEAAFYKTQLGPFGVPLDIRHAYTKVDWELWTAASTDDRALRQGFQARPAIGGVFAILNRTALKVGR